MISIMLRKSSNNMVISSHKRFMNQNGEKSEHARLRIKRRWHAVHNKRINGCDDLISD